MTEEILKIRAEELNTIRIVLESGVIHELPLSKVDGHSFKADAVASDHLKAIAAGLMYFSRKGVTPSIEFIIPVKGED